MSLKALKHPVTGKSVPNHIIIHTKYGRLLQSYESIVLIAPNDVDTVYIKADWDRSKTTLKNIGIFLGHNTKVTREKIKTGEIVLVQTLWEL